MAGKDPFQAEEKKVINSVQVGFAITATNVQKNSSKLWKKKKRIGISFFHSDVLGDRSTYLKRNKG